MERQTVLIVDDSELNRMMLMEILGEQYHYIEASDGLPFVQQCLISGGPLEFLPHRSSSS